MLLIVKAPVLRTELAYLVQTCPDIVRIARFPTPRLRLKSEMARRGKIIKDAGIRDE